MSIAKLNCLFDNQLTISGARPPIKNVEKTRVVDLRNARLFSEVADLQYYFVVEI